MATAYVVLKAGIDLPSEASKARVSKPLIDYALGLGVQDEPKLVELGSSADAAWVEDDTLITHDALRNVGANDHLVFRSFRSISPYPRTIIEGVRYWTGAGVQVHTLSCGRLSPHMPVIGELGALMLDAEQEVERLKAAAANAKAEAEREAYEVYRAATIEMLRNRQFDIGLPPPPPEPINGDEGRYLRYLRTTAGLTQRALAEKLGTDQSTISRQEATGIGPYVVATIRLLDKNFPAGSDPEDRGARLARATFVLHEAKRLEILAAE